MDVVPEAAGAEFLADGDAHAACQRCHGGQTAGAVEEWHAAVPSVAIWSGSLIEGQFVRVATLMVAVDHEFAGFGEARRARCVEQACRVEAGDVFAILVAWYIRTPSIDLLQQCITDCKRRNAQLLDPPSYFLKPLCALFIRIDQHDLDIRNLETMNHRIASQIVVQHRRRTPNAPQTQPDDDKISRVGEICADHVARLDTLLEEEVCPLHSLVVDLLPCVRFLARPDAQFVCVFGDVGGEGVPKTLAF